MQRAGQHQTNRESMEKFGFHWMNPQRAQPSIMGTQQRQVSVTPL
jgi:hypothetical protein